MTVAPFKPGPEVHIERCYACEKAFKVGDAYYPDINGFDLHASCCGAEPECFVDGDGDPLKPGAAVPKPLIWGVG